MPRRLASTLTSDPPSYDLDLNSASSRRHQLRLASPARQRVLRLWLHLASLSSDLSRRPRLCLCLPMLSRRNTTSGARKLRRPRLMLNRAAPSSPKALSLCPRLSRVPKSRQGPPPPVPTPFPSNFALSTSSLSPSSPRRIQELPPFFRSMRVRYAASYGWRDSFSATNCFNVQIDEGKQRVASQRVR